MKWLLNIIMWPFKAIFHLVFFIIELVGRFVAAVIGMVLILAGVIVSLTLIGAIVGVPLIIVGIFLVGASLASRRHCCE
ncbi:MAG: hypothetical protein K8R77_12725 [Anaerolineaceae bacterium]|nr:hypothetical protein [Anaerolineaceae bacterium]